MADDSVVPACSGKTPSQGQPGITTLMAETIESSDHYDAGTVEKTECDGKREEQRIGIGTQRDGCGSSKELAFEVDEDVTEGGNRMNVSESLRFGFVAENRAQLFYHWVLAVLIGTSLRMTTFPDAMIAADMGSGAGRYSRETSFLVSFGFTKAVSNLLVGWASDRPGWGRKAPHAVGWVAGLLLGSILLFAVTSTAATNGWAIYVVANVFLGAQQGLAWTTNIFMFMDILGPDHRALASAVSNCTGYLSSAFATFVSAAISAESSFAVVFGSAALGLAITYMLVQDTTGFVQMEAEMVLSSAQCVENGSCEGDYAENGAPIRSTHRDVNDNDSSTQIAANILNTGKQRRLRPSGSTTSRTRQRYDLVQPASYASSNTALASTQMNASLTPPKQSFGEVFVATCWWNRSTAVLCLGGLMANIVTSFAWGLTLIWGKQRGLSPPRLASIGFAFTLAKALSMVAAGRASDRCRDRRRFLLGGFSVTVLGLLLTAAAGVERTSGSGGDNDSSDEAIFLTLLLGGVVIGCGIGSVYCVMTGAISDHTAPEARASAIGTYKLWRDSGYAFGGLLTGLVADASGGSFATTTVVVASLVVVLLVLILAGYAEPKPVELASFPTRREENITAA